MRSSDSCVVSRSVRPKRGPASATTRQATAPTTSAAPITRRRAVSPEAAAPLALGPRNSASAACLWRAA